MKAEVQKAIGFLRQQAEEAGEDPNDFATQMLKDGYGETAERLGDFCDANGGDSVEILAMLMLRELQDG